MNLEKFISFRSSIQEVEVTPYGFKGFYLIQSQDDIDLFSSLNDVEIREIYYKTTNNTADHKNLKKGDEIIIAIDASKFSNYYETFDNFISFNQNKLYNEDFYIKGIDYRHSSENINDEIENYLSIQKILIFLKKLSTYERLNNGSLEFFFNKHDQICSIIIDYGLLDLKELNIQISVSDLEGHVFEKSDKEARKRLFINEMINILSIDGFGFKNVLKNWNFIHNSYKSSFQIYLSEFSFEKIKTSSQEYFHELTDRIYSTINKFSTYILAIPVAYILILRFFDFDGKSFAKDSILVVIGILYFVIIWFVLLNNLSKAFKSIENDITKFINSIKNEVNLKEITDSLKNQKNKLIPSQKRKIWLVRIVSLLILFMTIGAYYHIYSKRIHTEVRNAQLPTSVKPPLLSVCNWWSYE